MFEYVRFKGFENVLKHRTPMFKAYAFEIATAIADSHCTCSAKTLHAIVRMLIVTCVML